jgi:hypothetical protein
MNEQNAESYLNIGEVDGEVIEAEEPPKSEGDCAKCYGSGYVIAERNGVIGVVFTSTNTDSEGKPIRKLVPCVCEVDVSY